MVNWTIQGTRSNEKGLIYEPVQTFSTKREAVAAMMARRKAKTEIKRFGHHYQFVSEN